MVFGDLAGDDSNDDGLGSDFLLDSPFPSFEEVDKGRNRLSEGADCEFFESNHGNVKERDDFGIREATIDRTLLDETGIGLKGVDEGELSPLATAQWPENLEEFLGESMGEESASADRDLLRGKQRKVKRDNERYEGRSEVANQLVTQQSQQGQLVKRENGDERSPKEHIQILENEVVDLRSQLSTVTLEALEREQFLQARLRGAENIATSNREKEDELSAKLRVLINDMKVSESGLRQEISRLVFENAELKMQTKSTTCKVCKANKFAFADKRSSSSKSRVEQGSKTANIARVNSSSENHSRVSSKRSNLRSPLLENRYKDMLSLCKDQQEKIHGYEIETIEAKKREGLLQSTVLELKENIDGLRQSITSFERSEDTLKQELSKKDDELREAEKVSNHLRSDLRRIKVKLSETAEECGRYRHSRRNGSEMTERLKAYKRRTEMQLRCFSSKLVELQDQLALEKERSELLKEELLEKQNSETKNLQGKLQFLLRSHFDDNQETDSLVDSSKYRRLDSRTEGVKTDHGTGKFQFNDNDSDIVEEESKNISSEHGFHGKDMDSISSEKMSSSDFLAEIMATANSSCDEDDLDDMFKQSDFEYAGVSS